MLVSLKWLRDYVDLPDDLDVDDLAHRLTMASAEVEGVHRLGGDWDRDLVTVGRVLAVDPHPNADRLRLATVDFGGAEPQQVVCGAPNLEAGQHIAFAREGARLFDGHSGKPSTLKGSTIRGVESAGMVLSQRELGLSDEHEGILVLPAEAPVGTPLREYLGDVILDVHTWPNRADTMNMVGIAREIAAILGGQVRPPDEAYAEEGPDVAGDVSIVIEANELCERFCATLIEGITVGPSPEWMQVRLRAAGMRPINNVVDVTNYVMLEVGQPLHAYDADLVQGGIVVRLAREGEHLRTLDGVPRELTPEQLLITDDSGPIGLAGVMGGQSTEVSERTTRVLLEAAHWDPTTIRRTSTRLALRSEASSRFERGLSPEFAIHAARRATRLLVEECGGTARAGVVDVYAAPRPAQEASITRRRLDTVIGVSVPAGEVEAILTTLGFELLEADAARAGGGEPRFLVRVPWWRDDIAIPDDLAEEVVRLAGYDRLPETTISGRVPAWEPQPLRDLRDRLRDALVDAGMDEVVTYSLTTDEVLSRVVAPEDLAIIRPMRLRNTLSSDREVLRPTLRHAILEIVERNIRAGIAQIAVFESGRAFIPRREEQPLPDEREVVVGAISGGELDRWGRPTGRALDFFDAKGTIEAAIGAVGVAPDYVPDIEFGLMPGRIARLHVDGEPVGVLGEVDPRTLGQFEIEQPVLLFELDLARLLPRLPARIKAASPPRYPAVEQDLAVVVADEVPAGALQRVIEGSPLVSSARSFDVFRGGRLPEGKKSLAFAIRYQAPDRTLTTEDANREQTKILRRLEREFDAQQRT
ncbi:MAG: phenylalanine--tRNA ligase subunit beta [Dehalococcoidia bacterium]|nr:phenylalanine--tRNA ligase subunit beta [Dehalococcoidia bacterium]